MCPDTVHYNYNKCIYLEILGQKKILKNDGRLDIETTDNLNGK